VCDYLQPCSIACHAAWHERAQHDRPLRHEGARPSQTSASPYPNPNPQNPNQAELEPILSNMAEHSMAEAHGEHVARGDTDYTTLDGGFTAPRNAHGCTMAAHVR